MRSLHLLNRIIVQIILHLLLFFTRLLRVSLLLLSSALSSHAVFAYLLGRVVVGAGATPRPLPAARRTAALHHHHHLIIAVVLSFAGADFHELWHEGGGRHELVFEVVVVLLLIL